MTVALLELEPHQTLPAATSGLRLIVLARIACEEGASRAELAREIGPLNGGAGSHLTIEAELARLIRSGMAIELRSRFAASEAGHARLLADLGMKALPGTWSELRDGRLIAKALGMERDTAARIKALAESDALREAILAQTYALELRGAPSFPKLRAALALVALQRAFGNQIKSELSASAGFNAKASRVLAGQLLRKPRDAGTDKRLVALLAAEAVDCPKADAEALRTALLRRLATADGTAASLALLRGAPARRESEPGASAAATAYPAAKAPPAEAVVAASRPPAASRPDLQGFVAVVRSLANDHAEGWPGNRKALVSRVFTAVAAAHPLWGLTLVEFKAMLAECHRTGHLVLATADLKDKSRLDALRDSAITYKNTVWHLVRVEDRGPL